jgi:hypothetical protein
VTTAVTNYMNTTGTWDLLSDWIDPNYTMTPLERKVAVLCKKASMTNSEGRRFKEEKQWGQVQGNKARAAQMGWQVKHYSALMQSFHCEADLRLLEGSSIHRAPFFLALILQQTTRGIARKSHRCRHQHCKWQGRCQRPRYRYFRLQNPWRLPLARKTVHHRRAHLHV